MNDELPSITIGAPVRNRDWILPYYLDHLRKQNYPQDHIRFIFIVNDSMDKSLQILQGFAKKWQYEYESIDIIVKNMRAPEDERTHRRLQIYRTLAELRNDLLSRVETDYLFSIDSDILAPPETLMTLVESNKEIVAGVIRNDYIMQPNATYPNIRTNLLLKQPNGSFDHYFGYPQNALFEVDVTGAIYLLSRKVCETVRYGYDPQGEDIYFCMRAKEAGFSIWANSNIFAQHVMVITQNICRDCLLPCKAPYIEDNKRHPELLRCPKKITKRE
jgi:glycosyltransferase involved in cell wall biosynthesis